MSTPNNDGQPKPLSDAGEPPRIRYRIRFSKTDLLKWTSHRDLARLWERLVRRAQLVLSMTEGFHPKPRIGFPSALALGTESLDEVVELELAEELTAGQLLQRLCADDQPGLQINSVQKMPAGVGKAKMVRADYEIRLPQDLDIERTRSAIDHLRAQDTVTVQRKKKPLTVNVSEQIANLSITGDVLHLSLIASDAASLRPSDVLDLIDASDWIARGALITRSAVILEQEITPESESQIARRPDGLPANPHGQFASAEPLILPSKEAS